MLSRIFGFKKSQKVTSNLRMLHTRRSLHNLKSSPNNVVQIKGSEAGGTCLQMVEMCAISELLNWRGRLHVNR
jgi:hypothetical protein